MKYEVLRGFIDKVSGKPFEEGSEFECTEKRASEIQKKGNYLKPVEKETTKDK